MTAAIRIADNRRVRGLKASLARLILIVAFGAVLLVAYVTAESRVPEPIRSNSADRILLVAALGFIFGRAWKAFAFRALTAKAPLWIKIGQIALVPAFAFALFFGFDALAAAWIGAKCLTTNPLLFGASAGYLWRLIDRDQRAGVPAIGETGAYSNIQL